MLTPAERTLRARLAAHALHSKVDSREHVRPAFEASMARFERQVDPDGKLTLEERRRRAAHARKSHMHRLALLSAKARRAKAGRLDTVDQSATVPDMTRAHMQPERP